MFQSSDLFKFVRSVSAVENLLEGRLRFSKVEELNDPCELLDEINQNMVSASLMELRKTGYSDTEYLWLNRQAELLRALSPHNRGVPVPKNATDAHKQVMSSSYDNISALAGFQRSIVADIRSKVGILSLTKNWQGLPMWAHYAGNADGFVVIFDRLTNCFQGNETGVLDQVKPVIYSDVFEGMTFRPSSQEKLFFWKYSDWSYEKEYRVVSSLQNCAKRTVGSTHMWLRNIDPAFIKGVIIGWKVDQNTRKRLFEFCSQCGRDTDLYEARIVGASVRCDPLSIS